MQDTNAECGLNVSWGHLKVKNENSFNWWIDAIILKWLIKKVTSNNKQVVVSCRKCNEDVELKS